MSDIPAIASRSTQRRQQTGRTPFLARQLQKLMSQVAFGELTIVLPNNEVLYKQGEREGPSAKIVIRRWRTVWRLVVGGELAFADAYIEGGWWTPNLLAFLEFGARNESSMSKSISGSLAQRLLWRWQHHRNRNTKRGSKRNIAAHYDLGNAFYEQWLDRGMQYSSALFTHSQQPLGAAQQAKLDRVVELLDIKGGERVLEIGCGWGALMERLSPQCAVTGITLSEEQLAYAKARVGKADIRLQDYRDVPETYDRIVSIEMIEAVGESYWPTYFAKLRNALTQSGTVLLQAITIAEERFAKYRHEPDFIQRYIFPGGVLPTVEIIRREAARAGLELVAHQPFGLSYARTLAEWRARFLATWPAIEKLGFDANFRRMWEYYLCYCEVGFRNEAIDVGFYKLKPIEVSALSRG
ncbi:MAG: cyclopropane-fatty-acyl-phospholipid synthase family protein [Pseudolabrys sp.]|nr:cyclopropane-fatty-acyl-phospholipid synthase family protein [Pseudolabrys sp.]